MQMLFSVGLKQKISGCDIHYAEGRATEAYGSLFVYVPVRLLTVYRVTR